MVFLAVLGLFVLRGSRKWWLLAVSLLALFLSWGSNMMWFTELCFKILPGYNKFRAVSTALVIVQWTFPLLACLLLSELWKGEIPARKIRRGLAWATGITGGIALLFALFGPKMFGFSAPGDYPLLYNIAAHSGFNEAGARQFADYVSDAMSAERAKMLRADAWRSLLFVLVSAGLVLLYAKGRMKRGILTACFAGLVCLDLIPVDLRYLSWDDFVPARRTQLYPTEADKEILKDTTPGYRVANFAVNTFSDATTSYFHRSVGGYHGAKLQRYQDLIDRHLVPMNMEVYNMLNTRYFIVPEMSGRLEAQFNPDANGAAWFVAEVIPSDTPNEEIDALNRIDTKRQAVADRRFTDRLPGHRHGRHRRLHPADRLPGEPAHLRIRFGNGRHRRILRNILRQGLESLCGRHGGALLPGRLRTAGHGAAGRTPHRGVRLPCAEVPRGIGRDTRRLAHHPHRIRRSGNLCGMGRPA